MVLKQVGWMAAVGVVVGVGLAALLGVAGRALFFGLTPADPFVPAAAVLALTLVVLAAAYLARATCGACGSCYGIAR
jgi:hypothetical protein